MSTRKKTTKQPVPAFEPGAKLYIIHHQGRDGGILQAEVVSSDVKKIPLIQFETGKITGTSVMVIYELRTAYGPYTRYEDQLIKTFPEAARQFAERFLTLLK